MNVIPYLSVRNQRFYFRRSGERMTEAQEQQLERRLTKLY